MVFLICALVLSCGQRQPEVKKDVFLYILWADGKQEIYKGDFIDRQGQIELIRGSKIVQDTVYMKYDAFADIDKSDSTLTDSGYVYFHKIKDEYIYAMPTNFVKSNIRQYYITNHYLRD